MHPRRKLAAILLGLGAIAGFGSGFAHLAHCAHGHYDRRAEFERHIADVCVGAAERAKGAPAREGKVD